MQIPSILYKNWSHQQSCLPGYMAQAEGLLRSIVQSIEWIHLRWSHWGFYRVDPVWLCSGVSCSWLPDCLQAVLLVPSRQDPDDEPHDQRGWCCSQRNPAADGQLFHWQPAGRSWMGVDCFWSPEEVHRASGPRVCCQGDARAASCSHCRGKQKQIQHCGGPEGLWALEPGPWLITGCISCAAWLVNWSLHLKEKVPVQ